MRFTSALKGAGFSPSIKKPSIKKLSPDTPILGGPLFIPGVLFKLHHDSDHAYPISNPSNPVSSISGMPSFSDSIFLFVLALLLFGPKRLPVLARELGKWVGEFRRASNEFKMQMEEELRLSEQADRQKQIAAIEAAAPVPPPLEQPEHPHLSAPEPATTETYRDFSHVDEAPSEPAAEAAPPAPETLARETIDGVAVLPIATSGDLRMMPPSTGLPTPRSSGMQASADPLGGLLDAIPEVTQDSGSPDIAESHNLPEPANATPSPEPETAAHGH